MGKLIHIMLVLIVPSITLADKELVYEFIDDKGYVYKNGYKSGERFPLTKRYWYLSTKGAPSHIFLNISGVNYLNGFCFGGSAFKKHESGAVIMKCFNYNRKEIIKKSVLFETKDKHYISPGSCQGSKYHAYDPSNCKNAIFRQPDYWYTVDSTGDNISIEECMSIYAKAKNYNFDSLCN